MAPLRNLAVLITISPVVFLLFSAGRLQYRLVGSTFTMDGLSPGDPVFSSAVYKEYFGSAVWANVESFGCGVAVPVAGFHRDLARDESAFAAEALRVLWNERMLTQFSGLPWSSPPEVGSISSSATIRAEVVETGPTHMALTVTAVSNNFTGGLEVIHTKLDHGSGLAVVFIKYVWHNAEILRWKWPQRAAIWVQLTSRRMMLLKMVDALAVSAESSRGKNIVGVDDEL